MRSPVKVPYNKRCGKCDRVVGQVPVYASVTSGELAGYWFVCDAVDCGSNVFIPMSKLQSGADNPPQTASTHEFNTDSIERKD